MRLIVLLALLFLGAQSSVIGIDLGSELIKISLIRPGKKLLIVENEHSARSSPSLISFTDSGRLFGYTGQKDQLRTPGKSVSFFKHLLGTENEDARASSFFHSINKGPILIQEANRTSSFIKTTEMNLLPEEVMAMILEYAKHISELHGEGTVKDCVITYPSSWKRSQKLALVYAAQAAQMNVLSLIRENTAAALYYGLDRLDNASEHIAMFYNLGSSNLQVSLARYSTVNTTIAGQNKTVETIEMLAHETEEFVGGAAYDAKLADELVKAFREQTSKDPSTNDRAMTKFLKHANLAKKTLSANKEAHVIINGAFEGIDFKHVLHRDTLDQIIDIYKDKLVNPVRKALEKANLDISHVNAFELIGGVSRIPKIQDTLRTTFEVDLSTHLNGDEAMAHGAAIYAANASAVVQVKPIWLSEISINQYTAKVFDEILQETIVEDVIFDRNSVLRTYKEISFNETRDVVVEIHRSDHEKSTAISRHHITGIKENAEQYNQTLTVTLLFVVDNNELPQLYEAGAVVDNKLAGLYNDPETEKSKEDYEKERNEETKEETPEETPEETSEETLEEGEGDDDIEENVETKEVDQTKKEPQIPEKELKKLNISTTELDQPRSLTKEEFKDLLSRLTELKKTEEERKKVLESRNDLESLIYSLKDKLSDEEFIQVTTEEEREKYMESLDLAQLDIETEEFLELQSWDVIKKKKDIEKLVKDALNRESELKMREFTVSQARKNIAKMQEAIEELKKTKDWMTEDDLKPALTKINETLAWIDTKSSEQAELSLTEPPAFKCDDLKHKVSNAEKSVEKLKRMQKPREDDKKDPKKSTFDFKNMDWSNFNSQDKDIDEFIKKYKEKLEKEKGEGHFDKFANEGNNGENEDLTGQPVEEEVNEGIEKTTHEDEEKNQQIPEDHRIDL